MALSLVASSCISDIKGLNTEIGFMKMYLITEIVILAVFACITSGCATGRLADLKDCGHISLGVGLGLDATAKIGCLVHPSIGDIGSLTMRIGNESRDLPFIWQEQQEVWPVLASEPGDHPPFVSYYRFASLFGPSPDGCTTYDTSWFPWLPYNKTPNALSFHELTDCEVGVTLFFVSVRVGINPLEIVDFLLGFVGLDIAHDDQEKPTTGRTVPPEAGAVGVQ